MIFASLSFSAGPVIVKGRYTHGGSGEVTIRGLLHGQPWSQTIHVDLPALDHTVPAGQRRVERGGQRDRSRQRGGLRLLRHRPGANPRRPVGDPEVRYTQPGYARHQPGDPARPGARGVQLGDLLVQRHPRDQGGRALFRRLGQRGGARECGGAEHDGNNQHQTGHVCQATTKLRVSQRLV